MLVVVRDHGRHFGDVGIWKYDGRCHDERQFAHPCARRPIQSWVVMLVGVVRGRCGPFGGNVVAGRNVVMLGGVVVQLAMRERAARSREGGCAGEEDCQNADEQGTAHGLKLVHNASVGQPLPSNADSAFSISARSYWQSLTFDSRARATKRNTESAGRG